MWKQFRQHYGWLFSLKSPIHADLMFPLSYGQCVSAVWPSTQHDLFIYGFFASFSNCAWNFLSHRHTFCVTYSFVISCENSCLTFQKFPQALTLTLYWRLSSCLKVWYLTYIVHFHYKKTFPLPLLDMDGNRISNLGCNLKKSPHLLYLCKAWTTMM